MVCLGGLTRLTHSGLSIVEWKPLVGIIPPLNHQDWLVEFSKYQASPEFKLVSTDMILSEFKFIYWMEFCHRLLGRLIGLFFIIPCALLWRQLPVFFKKLSFGVVFLGAIQGVMGWYMVKSGLKDLPMVSPYRLTTHLFLAFILLGCLSVGILKAQAIKRVPHPKEKLIRITSILITLTIMYGGFVAGLKAGLIYNTFPLMGGQLIPGELLSEKPFWINFLTNHATVQWMHRILALLSCFHVLLFYLKDKGFYATIWLSLVILQLILGIATLIHQVPIILGVMHQCIGALLFSWSVVMIYKYTKDCKV
jgi:cytochrome c oxidase assembly protein subunit 15